MNKVYVSIGSNIGDRIHYIERAVDALRQADRVNVRAVSSLYETAPVGYEKQDDFLNIAVALETTDDAHTFLARCQSIERQFDRVRTVRWGPRTIDLDILLFNDDEINTDDLIVPHPRMTERAFVLVPLNEIAPDVSIPGTGETVNTLARRVTGDVRRYEKGRKDEHI